MKEVRVAALKKLLRSEQSRQQLAVISPNLDTQDYEWTCRRQRHPEDYNRVYEIANQTF